MASDPYSSPLAFFGAEYGLIFDHLRASALDDTQTLRLLKGEDI